MFKRVCFRVCLLTSPISTFVQSFKRFSGKRGIETERCGGKKGGVEEKTDYLRRLGELLAVLLLNLLQPAVGLQQEGRGVCEKAICRLTDRHTKRGSCEIESSVRKCTCSPFQPIHAHTHTHTHTLTSASWQCVPAVKACGLLAQCQSQCSCVPAGSDGHSAQWVPLPL